MTAPSDPALPSQLTSLLDNSHAPYSGVHVAALVEDADGRLHAGVNVENAAYPEGVCAEASAISALITAGGGEIARVFLASSLPGFIWPCGGCRQKIFEFSAHGCEVVSFNEEGDAESHTIEELLPYGFRLERR